METVDIVVVGAGAAGLMCAMVAAGRGRRVVVLDHAAEAGAKILISGGGRCNFTNEHTAPDRFLSANPRFPTGALRRYTPADFVALIAKHRIPYHEKTLGQLFCDRSARDVVAMLLAECAVAGAEVRLGTRVTGIDGTFRIATDRGEIAAASLVLATGGLSIPKLGATGFAYDVARQYGLGIVAPAPGLVPLMFGGDDLALMRPLSGVAMPASVQAGRQAFAEALLFTHRGLSGPAVLQASSYSGALSIDLLPGRDAAAMLLDRKRTRPRIEVRTALAEWLPTRLAHAWPVDQGALADQPDRVLRAVGAALNHWTPKPTGSEGYAKAEVTLGGIDTRGLSSQTMGALTVPGLFAIGEAVDVTGWLGGYNFQWAWSSGWCAGMAA